MSNYYDCQFISIIQESSTTTVPPKQEETIIIIIIVIVLQKVTWMSREAHPPIFPSENLLGFLHRKCLSTHLLCAEEATSLNGAAVVVATKAPSSTLSISADVACLFWMPETRILNGPSLPVTLVGAEELISSSASLPSLLLLLCA